MFAITLAPAAREDLRWFPKSRQVAILEAITEQLSHQPELPTRNRKRLRPGHRTEWELRNGDFRIFYVIDREASVVQIVRIGYKQRNKLFFRGEECQP